MYLECFGLAEKLFQITPDPRFLYMSRRHRDGFAHLNYMARMKQVDLYYLRVRWVQEKQHCAVAH